MHSNDLLVLLLLLFIYRIVNESRTLEGEDENRCSTAYSLWNNSICNKYDNIDTKYPIHLPTSIICAYLIHLFA